MAEGVQSFKKHTRILPGFHYFVLPVLFLNVLIAIRRLWLDPTAHFAWEAVVAAAPRGLAALLVLTGGETVPATALVPAVP